MRAQLLEAEAAHYAKTNGSSTTASEVPPAITPASTKRKLEAGPGQDGEADEDIEAKRRRVLEETRDIDADSEGSQSESSDEDRWVTLTLDMTPGSYGTFKRRGRRNSRAPKRTCEDQEGES